VRRRDATRRHRARLVAAGVQPDHGKETVESFRDPRYGPIQSAADRIFLREDDKKTCRITEIIGQRVGWRAGEGTGDDDDGASAVVGVKTSCGRTFFFAENVFSRERSTRLNGSNGERVFKILNTPRHYVIVTYYRALNGMRCNRTESSAPYYE